jgi:hypothetical protein
MNEVFRPAESSQREFLEALERRSLAAFFHRSHAALTAGGVARSILLETSRFLSAARVDFTQALIFDHSGAAPPYEVRPRSLDEYEPRAALVEPAAEAVLAQLASTQPETPVVSPAEVGSLIGVPVDVVDATADLTFTGAVIIGAAGEIEDSLYEIDEAVRKALAAVRDRVRLAHSADPGALRIVLTLDDSYQRAIALARSAPGLAASLARLREGTDESRAPGVLTAPPELGVVTSLAHRTTTRHRLWAEDRESIRRAFESAIPEKHRGSVQLAHSDAEPLVTNHGRWDGYAEAGRERTVMQVVTTLSEIAGALHQFAVESRKANANLVLVVPVEAELAASELARASPLAGRLRVKPL